MREISTADQVLYLTVAVFLLFFAISLAIAWVKRKLRRSLW